MAKAKRKEREKFEEGNYPVDGIAFFTKDTNGVPYFKVETWQNREVFVARYRTSQGEADGPPGSIQPHELALFAAAWGVDPAMLPKDRKQALAPLEHLIAQAGKTVDVYVGKSGWIQSVAGAYLPIGRYLFHRGQITSRKGGEAVWYAGDYGDYIRVGLIVASNADGTNSHYTGSAVDVWVMRKPMGILSALVPTQMGWLPATDDLALAAFDSLLQAEADTLVYGEIILKSGNRRPSLDAATLEAVPVNAIGTHPATAAPSPTPTTASSVLPPGWDASVAFLMQAIQSCVGADPAFVGEKLTSAGKQWCKPNLGPIAKANNVTNKFGAMTPEIVGVYLEGLVAQGQPVAEFLAASRAGDATEGDSWDDDEDDDTTWE